MIVDTHCHVSDGWYEPAETLLFQMDRCGVERAWLVQLLGVYDNAYQSRCAAGHPDRFVNIVGVDWTRADAVAEIQRLAAEGARGVRLRPGARSPGGDPLAIWRAAHDCALVVSCIGTATQFAEPAFDALIAELPDLPIVLEHLGGLARADVGDASAAVPAITALARHRSIHLKLPGLGQLLSRDKLATAQSRGEALAETPLATIRAAFGPERLMWGSDFPVVASREGYRNALTWAREALPEADRGAILGGAAASLFESASHESTTKGRTR